MFLRGKTPALRVPLNKGAELCAGLERAGYRIHGGPRTTHQGELEAWVRPIPDRRQCHVQIVKPSRGSDLLVFAHTEPAGFTLAHLIAALFDRVSYQAGAKLVREDLRLARVQL